MRAWCRRRETEIASRYTSQTRARAPPRLSVGRTARQTECPATLGTRVHARTRPACDFCAAGRAWIPAPRRRRRELGAAGPAYIRYLVKCPTLSYS